jgi:hypothetical protein
MRLLTARQKRIVLKLLSKIRQALCSDDVLERIKAIDSVAEITGIIGGLDALQAELIKINIERQNLLYETDYKAPTISPQALYNGIVEIINKNGLTSLDELLDLLKEAKKREDNKNE